MLVFMAFVFCVACFAFIFAIIIPSLLNLIQKTSGKKITLNFGILSILFFLTFVISLWVYAQLVLIISGDFEQLKYNISYLVPNLVTPRSFLHYIQLSFKYDGFAFTFSFILLSCLFIVSMFLYLKNILKKESSKYKIVKFSILVAVFLYMYCNIPFTIIEKHEQAVEKNKSEQEESRKAVIRSNLQPLYNRLNLTGKGEGSFITLPTQKICSNNIYPHEDKTLSCGETGFLCANISILEKDPKDIAYDCRKNGW